MAERVPVAVVGAGPTGLAMGIELARAGVAFRIVDAAPGVHPNSRAIGIQARTLEWFERLGIVDEFLRAGVRWNAVNIYSAGRRIVAVPFAGIHSRYAYILSVPQTETETLLQDKLAALGVTVERNTTVTKVEAGEEAVRLTLRRADGTQEALEAAYVAGCDGAHSVVREACGEMLAGVSVDTLAFALGDVVASGPYPDDELSIFTSEGSIAAFFPLPGGRVRIITASPQTVHATEEPALDEFQAIVDRVTPQPVKLSAPVWLTRFRINQRKAAHYQCGRMFVVGDAAHIHSPIGAQGMNTGIQDAINLAWKLALVTHSQAAPELLASFDAERSPVGNDLILATNLAGILATAPRPLRFLRDRIMPVLTALHPVQDTMRSLVSELAINYRHSAILFDERLGMPHRWRHGVRAGDRAPDADLTGASGAPATIFEQLHDAGHVVLLFADPDGPAPHTAAWEAATRAFPGPVKLVTVAPAARPEIAGVTALVDADGDAYEAYFVRQSAAFVIRPDGYVGAVAEPADPAVLANYAARLSLRG